MGEIPAPATCCALRGVGILGAIPPGPGAMHVNLHPGAAYPAGLKSRTANADVEISAPGPARAPDATARCPPGCTSEGPFPTPPHDLDHTPQCTLSRCVPATPSPSS